MQFCVSQKAISAQKKLDIIGVQLLTNSTGLQVSHAVLLGVWRSFILALPKHRITFKLLTRY